MGVIQQKESGILDLKASQHAYIAQGKPRRAMLRELLYKVQAVCPDLNPEQLKAQVRLAANAIFAESKESPIQPRRKGLRIKARTLH
jgi:hypothetical protein